MANRRRNAAAATAVCLVLAGAALAQTRGVRVLRPEAESVGGGAAPEKPVNQPAADQPVAPPPAPTPAPAPSPAKCDRTFATADLVFDDSRAFDTTLAALLRKGGPSVVVDVPAFNPDQPPERLGPWLSEVQKSGGAVGRRDIICTRGFGLLAKLASLFRGNTTPIQEAVHGYDSVLWVEKATGKVTQLQFVKRA